MTAHGVKIADDTKAASRARTRVNRRGAHRAGDPGDANRRCCADHGLGHEIVKKPFATPFGGEYAS
jgi:hypothetical protein